MRRSGSQPAAPASERGCDHRLDQSRNGTPAPRAAAVGGGQRHPPAGRSDDRAVRAAGGHLAYVALADPLVRERQLVRAGRRVQCTAPEEREHDVLARVQGGERADPLGRRVAGDEEDGLHTYRMLGSARYRHVSPRFVRSRRMYSARWKASGANWHLPLGVTAQGIVLFAARQAPAEVRARLVVGRHPPHTPRPHVAGPLR